MTLKSIIKSILRFFRPLENKTLYQSLEMKKPQNLEERESLKNLRLGNF